MPIFERPPTTPEELERSKPLELTPEQVQEFDERTWYERAFRGDAPQLTLRAVVMGTVLGFFLSFTNIYVGLKTGWFLGVALTACILSFASSNALFRVGIFKSKLTILESACMQSTASSAGYATGNTLVSAVPAMLLLTVSDSNPLGTHERWYVLMPWVLCLALLGVMLAIPMKRTLVNRERLKFPSGTASAVTLQGLYSQGAEAADKARALIWMAVISGIGKLVFGLNAFIEKDAVTHAVVLNKKTGLPMHESLLPDSSNIFDWIRQVLPLSVRNAIPAYTARAPGAAPDTLLNLSSWNVSLAHEFVLVGAGILVGLRTCIWMVLGNLLIVFYLGPKGLTANWENASHELVTAVTSPGKAWKEIAIWLGAPMIVAHGLTAFAGQWRTIARSFSGFRNTHAADPAARTDGSAAAPFDLEKALATVEVPMKWFVTGVSVASVGIVLIAWRAFQVPPHYGVLAIVMTFFLGLVACRSTGETDITPGGAMGKLMQLTYGKLIPQSTTINLMTAAITSGSSLAAADLLTDLKSGYLLGAHPRKQFLAQAAGILTGALASTLAFFVLVPDASVLMGQNGRAPEFAAPGAQQWKAVADLFRNGIQNLHPLDRDLIPIGLALGCSLSIVELFFPKKKNWIPSATGIGLGMILPFAGPFSMLIGAVLAWALTRIKRPLAEKYLVPLSAGAIAGESIIGVVVAGLNNTLFK
jgi:OPT family oligopeptide transporter